MLYNRRFDPSRIEASLLEQSAMSGLLLPPLVAARYRHCNPENTIDAWEMGKQKATCRDVVDHNPSKAKALLH